MDAHTVELTIKVYLKQMRERLEKAASIAKAAETCADAGNVETGIEIALDVEQLVYEVNKGIDNKIVSNCTTHFYGRMSSPATIEATRELMAAKGGAGEDIGRLSRGEFYFSTEAVHRPIRIRTPLCLTWHPPNPLTAEEVAAKSRASAHSP